MQFSKLNKARNALRPKAPKNGRAISKSQRISLVVETLESRDLMSVTSAVAATLNQATSLVAILLPPQPTAAGLAVINGLPAGNVQTTALADYKRDGGITRNDMLDIFNKGTAGYTAVTSNDVVALENLINNAGTVNMPGYVQNLAYKALWDSCAPTYYSEGLLNSTGLNALIAKTGATTIYGNQGYLVNQKAAAQSILGQVDNFFLGLVRPDATYTSNGTTYVATYQQVNLPLFNGTPTYLDVCQGDVGDCWLMASLAEVADCNPSIIKNMFIDNGDGTFTVRLDKNTGAPDYVTVDKYLPFGAANDPNFKGQTVFDHPLSDLWVALVEKAYAQENAAGWIGTGDQGVSSYGALNNGQVNWAMTAINCIPNSTTSIYYVSILNLTVTNAGNIAAAWQQGQYVCVCTGDNPNSSTIVKDHVYALIGDSNGLFTLFNPWGAYTANGPKSEFVVANANFIGQNFINWVAGGAAATTAQPAPSVGINYAQTGKTHTETVVQTQWSLPQNAGSLQVNYPGLDLIEPMLTTLAAVQNQSFFSPLTALDGAFTGMLVGEEV